MSGAEPWLAGYLLSEPECVAYLVMAFGGLAAAALSGLAALSAKARHDDEEAYLDGLAEPVRVYRYSPNGEVRAWDGSAEFVRAGSRAGSVRRGVLSLEVSGDRSGRFLEASYPDGATERIPLGPAGWHEARRAANIAMRFAGRHING